MARLVTHDELFDIFTTDAQYVGDGLYSIWAPKPYPEPGRVFDADTAQLWLKFKESFRIVEGKYDLDTVWEAEEE